MELDEVDYRILLELQRDARAPLKHLADAASVSIPTARARVLRLKELGVIKRFTVVLDSGKLFGEVSAFVMLKAKLPHVSRVLNALKESEQILEAYLTTGQHDIVMKISATDMRSFEDFILQKLSKIEGIELYTSDFIVETVKEEQGLPIRPGYGLKLKCRLCEKMITDEFVKKKADNRELFFCSETCARAFLESSASTETFT